MVHIFPNLVIDKDNEELFRGTPTELAIWLRENMADQPLWVYIGKSNYIITASEFMDLRG